MIWHLEIWVDGISSPLMLRFTDAERAEEVMRAIGDCATRKQAPKDTWLDDDGTQISFRISDLKALRLESEPP